LTRAGFAPHGRAPLTPAARYDRVAIALHWTIAAALLAQLAFGFYVDGVPRGTPARGVLVNLHKSSGMVLGLLVVLRLGWRLAHRAPPLPATLPRWQQRAAQASHVALYACMLLIPLIGYVASNFSRHGVNLFNQLRLPPWGVDSPAVYNALNGLHEVLGKALVVLLCVHVAAAVWHWQRRDGVFARMAWARGAPTNGGERNATLA
jgi:cytochrome b561